MMMKPTGLFLFLSSQMCLRRGYWDLPQPCATEHRTPPKIATHDVFAKSVGVLAAIFLALGVSSVVWAINSEEIQINLSDGTLVGSPNPNGTIAGGSTFLKVGASPGDFDVPLTATIAEPAAAATAEPTVVMQVLGFSSIRFSQALSAGTTFAYLIEPPGIAPAPGEPTITIPLPTGGGAILSDVVQLDIAATPGAPGARNLTFTFNSDPNLTPPPTSNLIFPTPGNPYTNVFTENGGSIDVASALFPNAKIVGGRPDLPFQVFVKSCSEPCEVPVPEPSAWLLLATGFVARLFFSKRSLS